MKTLMGIVTVLIVTGLLAPACTNDSGDMFVSTGTVVFLSFEGGFYGIKGDDGKNYDPMNLATEFRKDGLRVRFEAKELPNHASFHMWGTMIEIKQIEKM